MQTRQWILNVVIGCNFCPFAARVVKDDSIRYRVVNSPGLPAAVEALMQEAARLDADAAVETTLIIFPEAFSSFEDYLELVDVAEQLLHDNGYEGIYQVASFHPLYRFAGSTENDAANYTNRSPYPMLHLLREASVEKALEHFKNPDDIPQRNVAFAREKGLAFMKALLNLSVK